MCVCVCVSARYNCCCPFQEWNCGQSTGPQLTWIGYRCRWLKSSVQLVVLLRQLTLPLPGGTRNCLKISSSTIACAASLWHGRLKPLILGSSLPATPSMLSRLTFSDRCAFVFLSSVCLHLCGARPARHCLRILCVRVRGFLGLSRSGWLHQDDAGPAGAAARGFDTGRMLGHISAMLQGCLVCSPGRQ